jgi:hypothetical protein
MKLSRGNNFKEMLAKGFKIGIIGDGILINTIGYFFGVDSRFKISRFRM